MTDDTESPAARARRTLAAADTCTLATASPDGRPEAATVRFVADDAFDLYVTTQSTYRKYHNVTANPRVAVVVDGPDNLQLEGTAREVDGEAAAFVRRRYEEKYGPSDYLTNADSVFLAIETDWARLLVDGTYPPEFAVVLGEDGGDPHGTETTR
ncbi:MAG: pyridoxamine 5'-phosphate oxidase family protein [Halobaculum sp.]